MKAVITIVLTTGVSVACTAPAAPKRPVATFTCSPASTPTPGLDGHLDVEQVVAGELDDQVIAVSAGAEGTVQVRDARTLKAMGKPLPGQAPIALARLRGVPIVLISSKEGIVQGYDLRSRSKRGPSFLAGKGISKLATGDEDGTPILATWSEEGIKIYDLRTGRTRRLWDWPVGQLLAITRINGVPALVTGAADSLDVWNLRTGQKLRKGLQFHDESDEPEDRGPDFDRSAIVRRGGRPVVLLSTGSQRIRVWDPATHKRLVLLKPHWGVDALAENLALSVDEFKIVAWNPDDGAELTSFPLKSRVTTVATSGGLVVTGGPDNAVRSYDLRTGRQTGVANGSSLDRLDLLRATDDVGVVRYEDSWQAWNPTTNAELGPPVAVPQLAALAIGPHRGRYLVATTKRSVIQIWELRTGKEYGRPFTKAPGDVSALAIGSLRGRTVIVAETGGSLFVWDLGSRTLLYSSVTKQGPLVGLRLAELGGRPVAVTLDEHSLGVFDLATGSRLKEFALGATPPAPKALAIGHVRCTLVAVVTKGWKISTLDLNTGGDLTPVLEAESNADQQALTMYGDRLLIADEGDIELYDLATSRRLTMAPTGRKGRTPRRSRG
ncbi:WD40 repeat domain-containing protein [Nonomuraea africana]|uniref:WD40 repeat domain-containing protein n=1 Tax=Nonomuraea africana TaxID=46171 RepID=UPI00340DE8AA